MTSSDPVSVITSSLISVPGRHYQPLLLAHTKVGLGTYQKLIRRFAGIVEDRNEPLRHNLKINVKKTVAERRPDGIVSLRYACRHSGYLRGISSTTSGDGLIIDYVGGNTNLNCKHSTKILRANPMQG
ncbi:hypothetical protein Y032_0190g1237 [Ancylostoma ceylanicum]|uniref:Uncharacterized protein n=1 Tax=Ancylostoma ceylanicum TaxID=53326 RepID=A0A016SPX3_9BILA|nr:hypothetical protein Y032_0190g1237 [Ancylostoma ceylanicum]